MFPFVVLIICSADFSALYTGVIRSTVPCVAMLIIWNEPYVSIAKSCKKSTADGSEFSPWINKNHYI